MERLTRFVISMRIRLGDSYVYYHKIDGEVFYVGMGKGARAFDQTLRNEIWFSLVRKHREYDVEIVRYFDNPQLAYIFEGDEIRRLNPVANKMGKTKHQRIHQIISAKV
jgi:hypothetical protein